MPLHSVDEPGVDDFRTDNVVFYMETASGNRTRCAVTRPALVTLSRTTASTAAARLAAFDLNRHRLERIASAKFDRREIDQDGTVYVMDADLGRFG